jgi:hypothetical protein
MAEESGLTERLTRALRAVGLSRSELARATGIPEGTIGAGFAGRKWRPQDVARIADILELQDLPREPNTLREQFPKEVTRNRRVVRDDPGGPRFSSAAVYLEMAQKVFEHDNVFVSFMRDPSDAGQMRVVAETRSRNLFRDLVKRPAGRFVALTYASDSGSSKKPQERRVPGALWGYLLAIGGMISELPDRDRGRSGQELLDAAKAHMRFYIIEDRPAVYPWCLNPAIRLLIGFRSAGIMTEFPLFTGRSPIGDHFVLLQIDGASLRPTRPEADEAQPVVHVSSESLIKELRLSFENLFAASKAWKIHDNLGVEELMRAAKAGDLERKKWITQE